MSLEQNTARAYADLDAVYAAGKQAEYDAFWAWYLNNGNPHNLDCAFARPIWTNETFKPEHNLVPTRAYMMFRNCGIKDLVAALNACGRVLDTSQCTDFQYMFMNSLITKVGVIDTRNANSLYSVFSNAHISSIEKIILRDDGSQKFFDFITTPALVDVVIEGTIGQNGWDMRDCKKLSRASHESVVAALSTTTTGLTVTFSLAAVNKAFETAAGANNGSTSLSWSRLTATRSNWTILLA